MPEPSVRRRARVRKASADSGSWERLRLRWLPPEMQEMYAQDMWRGVFELSASMSIAPPQETARAAHWLVSSAVVLGHPALAAILRSIEQAALQGCVTDKVSVFRSALKQDILRSALPDKHKIDAKEALEHHADPLR